MTKMLPSADGITRLLVLYQYKPEVDYDCFLHMKYVENLNQHPGIQAFAYGLGDLHVAYPTVARLPYHKDHTLEEIKMHHFDFNAILVMTKSRCFSWYNPKKDEARGCWLPSDFKEWRRTPKVVLEEDYHYEKCDHWYMHNNIDLILQRHLSQVRRQETVPMKWFPFSVDTDIFNTTRTSYTDIYRFDEDHYQPITPVEKTTDLTFPNGRVNKVGFLGSAADEAYELRRKAMERLKKCDLGEDYFSRKVRGDYLRILRQYTVMLSCGSKFEICAAKNFEIIASGAVLFTNEFVGMNELFGQEVCAIYDNKLSNLERTAHRLLNHKEEIETRVKRGLRCIELKHSHKVRNEELLAILRGL